MVDETHHKVHEALDQAKLISSSSQKIKFCILATHLDVFSYNIHAIDEFKHTVALLFNLCLPGQNETWVKLVA